MSATMPQSVASVFPCSPNQLQFINFDQQGAGKAALNFAFRYQIDGPLQHAVLQQAFDRLIVRHEILRTCFVPKGGLTQQMVMAAVSTPITLTDLSHLSEDSVHAEALELGRRDAEKPFDLGRAPLLRLSMLRLSTARHVLLFTVHAAIIDGWSIGILVAELGCLISAIGSGQTIELPPVEIPFGDYARWQQAVGAGGGFDDDLKYWTAELRGIGVFRLPPTRPTPAERRFPSQTRGIVLDRAITDQAAAFARQRGATFYHLALAALCSALYAH
jgi:hypothetical protein